MSKHKGHPLKAVRLDHERMSFDYTHRGLRVRGTIMIEALTALIYGEVDNDTNLSKGESPMNFADFVNKTYLPLDAAPRLSNPRSLAAETDLMKSLGAKLGTMSLHEISGKDAERCKSVWHEQGLAANTIKRRWHALGRVLDCAKAKGLIKNNLLHKIRGLACAAGIWLRLEEIEPLLIACEKVHPRLRVLIEFLILTGARIGEAQLLLAGDIRDGVLWLPTLKQGGDPRAFARPLNIKSLGPKFAALLPKLQPHPVSKLYFYANDSKMEAITESYAHKLFKQALAAVGRTDFTLHDCRGTFATHRAMVVDNFRQLQAELGHGDPKSCVAYLARVRQFDRRASIFYQPPRKRRGPAHQQVLPPAIGPAAHEGDAPQPPLLS